MQDDAAWGALLGRVRALTGLGARDAAKVAFELNPDVELAPQTIVEKAIDLGFDVERKHAPRAAGEPIPEVTTDPAEVLMQVYLACPRALPKTSDDATQVYFPRIGKAPEKAQELMPDVIEQLPEDVRALLVKVDLAEAQVTFWLRDEANNIDRPIGPIDISRYDSGDALHRAFETLLARLPIVLRADFN